MVKPRKSGTVRELERQLSKALHKGNNQLVSDLYIDIAEEYRRDGRLEAAVEAYKSSLTFSEKCFATENAAFAHRAIAEMSVDPSINDDKGALSHGREYLLLAERSSQVHLIQLSYHVYGWLHFQIYLNSGAKDKELLVESRNWCEKGLAYLNKNAVFIDSDAKAVRIGQDSKARRARLRQVLSQIYDKLGDRAQAMSHHNAAFAYAVKSMDFDLQYRCLLSKLNFIGDQRIKTAVDLVHVASNLSTKEHVDAKFILAQEKIRAGDFEGAKWDMVSMLSGNDFNSLDNDEQSFFQQCLIAVYKAVERLRKLEKMSTFERMKIYEKIADEFIELDFRETSLEFYKRMLECAKTTSDRLKGLVSVAETAKDLGDFEKAYEFYSKIEVIESSLELEDRKRAETAICLLEVAAKLETLPTFDVRKLFIKAERLSVTNCQKCSLYEIYLEYLQRVSGDGCEVKELKSKLEYIKSNKDDAIEVSPDFEDSSEEWTDKFSELTESEILARCHVDATRRSMEERIRQEKDKKINLYGETRLHEAARGNDLEYLKLLIKADYNINARDEGGWTPLHEAVGALKLENVRLLVEAGACLDIRSNEGTLSADGERTDSGGLTPLMEACDRGSTAIASCLLKFGANVTLRNKDNWTALDFFRNAIQVGLVEEEDMSAASRLIVIMENRLRQANAPVNKVPPPKKLSTLNLQRKVNSTKEKVINACRLSPDKKNLLEYRRIMRDVGRGDVHERSSMSDSDEKLVASFNSDENCFQYASSLVDDLGFDVAVSSPSATVGFSEDLSLSPKHVAKRKRSRFASSRNNIHQARKRRNIQCSLSDSEDEIITGYERTASIQEERHKEMCCSSSRSSQSFQTPSSGFLNADKAATAHGISNMKLGPSKAFLPQTFCAKETPLQEIRDIALQNLIFIKINFKKTDGSKIKVKGIPFSRTVTVSEIRARCFDDLSAEGEVTDLAICQGDCELSDETPISLVLDGIDNSLDCVVGEISKLGPLQTYLRKATVAKSNVVRALNEAANGSLNLADFCIEKEAEALSNALLAFPLNSLSELTLSGNALPRIFIKSISYLARFLSVLKLESCVLDSQAIAGLLGDNSVCGQLSYLDLSYNDISSLSTTHSLLSFLNLCPNLKSLQLSSCNLNEALLQDLLDALKSLVVIERLNISHNPSVTSEFVTEVVSTCCQLLDLNIANTSFCEFTSNRELTCRLKRFSLYGCDLADDFILKWFPDRLDSFQFIDFSYTRICCSDLKIFLKQKAARPPILTVKLYGCLELEEQFTQFVDLLHSHVTSDITIRFQLTADLRERVLSLISSSFAFCLK